MEFVPSIFVSSLAGAALFFAGGLLSAAGRRTAREKSTLAQSAVSEVAAARLARARAEEDERARGRRTKMPCDSSRNTGARCSALAEQLEKERALHEQTRAEKSTVIGRLEKAVAHFEAERASSAQAHGAGVGGERAALRSRSPGHGDM